MKIYNKIIAGQSTKKLRGEIEEMRRELDVLEQACEFLDGKRNDLPVDCNPEEADISYWREITPTASDRLWYKVCDMLGIR